MGDVTLVLREARDEALGTKTFLFDAAGLAGVAAGQYLIVKLDVPADPRRGSRSFTMANAPTEDRVMITTRIRSSSPFKQSLAALRPGDRIPAKGPFGKFVLHTDDAPALFLAGGIGVTPFRSMIKHALDTGRDIPMTLIASDRVPEAIAFRAELDGWSRAHPALRVARTVTQPQMSKVPWSGRVGRIDVAWIRENLPDPGNPIAYVAGPPGFVTELRGLLHQVGVPDDRVRVEQFIGY